VAALGNILVSIGPTSSLLKTAQKTDETIPFDVKEDSNSSGQLENFFCACQKIVASSRGSNAEARWRTAGGGERSCSSLTFRETGGCTPKLGRL